MEHCMVLAVVVTLTGFFLQIVRFVKDILCFNYYYWSEHVIFFVMNNSVPASSIFYIFKGFYGICFIKLDSYLKLTACLSHH